MLRLRFLAANWPARWVSGRFLGRPRCLPEAGGFLKPARTASNTYVRLQGTAAHWSPPARVDVHAECVHHKQTLAPGACAGTAAAAAVDAATSR